MLFSEIISLPNGALGRFSFSIYFPAVEPVENASASVHFPCFPLKFSQGLDPWFLP